VRHPADVGRILRTPLVWLLAAVAAGVGVLLLTAGGDDSNPTPRTNTAASPQPPSNERHPPTENEQAGSTHAQVQEAVRENPAARLDPEQRAVVRVVRDYMAALDARDGARACSQFVPGALGAVRFPRDRGGCARSLSASIGYRDPRGFPVFRSVRVARVTGVKLEGDAARVTATTVTQFAGNRQPSVEDDLVYLTKHGDRWLIAKPSAELYRALGAGPIPPSVLTPP
jgi:ketosteroid isomerase-like protein